MALGTVKAARSVTLYPQVMGIVTEILFTPGRPVTAGAPLLRLEDDEQKIAMDRARVDAPAGQGDACAVRGAVEIEDDLERHPFGCRNRRAARRRSRFTLQRLRSVGGRLRRPSPV